MTEKRETGPSPKEQEYTDEERLAQWMADHPEPTIQRRECGPEIAEFEAAVISFEEAHPLAELHAIVDISPQLATAFEFAKELSLAPEELENSLRHVTLQEPIYAEKQRAKIDAARSIVLTPEDAKKYEIRMAAKKGIMPIAAKLNILKKETDISDEKYGELDSKRQRLERAIGSVMKNNMNESRVDHN